jgi:hypothetical protein
MKPFLTTALFALVLSAPALAQTPNTHYPITYPHGEQELRVKFAGDYDAGRYKDVIGDEAALEKLHAMDIPTAILTAQAYYRAGDMPGCVKYIQETFYPPMNRSGFWVSKESSRRKDGSRDATNVIPALLKRCQKS